MLIYPEPSPMGICICPRDTWVVYQQDVEVMRLKRARLPRKMAFSIILMVQMENSIISILTQIPYVGSRRQIGKIFKMSETEVMPPRLLGGVFFLLYYWGIRIEKLCRTVS